jgi:hypothetical protein
MNAFSVGYEDLEYEMVSHSADPYPTWTDDRGQADPNPWTQQAVEVQFQPRLRPGPQNGSVVDAHRIEGATLDPGRVLTHPSRIVAPLLISSDQPQTFDIPAVIIQWAPNPIVQRSHGQYTLAVDDMRHTTPKQLLGYSYDALSQQEIADEAALRIRRAMYGR